MNRGQIVIVDFPFTSGAQSKVRPALIIQNDRENRRLSKTIVTMITGNLHRIAEPTHLLIDPSTPDAASCGLHGQSLVSCVNVYTIDQASVKHVIGSLSSAAMVRVDACLRHAFDL